MVMRPLALPSEPAGMASMASTRVAEEIMAAPTPWNARKSTRRSNHWQQDRTAEVAGQDGEPEAVDRVAPVDVADSAEDHGQADAGQLVGDQSPGDAKNVGVEGGGNGGQRHDEDARGEAREELAHDGVGEKEPIDPGHRRTLPHHLPRDGRQPA